MRFVSFLLALLLTSPSWAGIGSITEFSGAATIKRGKETLTATKGFDVEQNDKIETKNGKLKITFKDNTVVSVTEHSALVIDDFVFDPKNAAGGKLGLKAAAGTVRYVSGNIAHANPNAVNIKTPTAAIAVRGTDFVMSVNEVGSSMIILMPTCDWESSAVKGLTCGSGAIDVESGPNLVKLNRPFQATMVETAGAPPSPPITVNLFGSSIGNNLQIAPPKTMSGGSVVAAARAAAQATGAAKESKKEDKDHDKEDKDDAKDVEKQAVASKAENAASKKEQSSDQQKVTIPQPSEENASTAAASTSEENPYVLKIWKDKSETQQIGWGFESLSQNNKNYALVLMPIDTKVQVTVTQDMLTNSWTFAPGKPQGQIVINQTFR